jgi:hypothetical protein
VVHKGCDEVGMRLVEMNSDRDLLNLGSVFLKQMEKRKIVRCPRNGPTEPSASAQQSPDFTFRFLLCSEELHR